MMSFDYNYQNTPGCPFLVEIMAIVIEISPGILNLHKQTREIRENGLLSWLHFNRSMT